MSHAACSLSGPELPICERVQNLSSKTAALMGRTKTPPADQAQTFARFSSSGGWRDLSLDLRSEFGFGAREVIGHLKAQPDRRRAAEIAGEAERGFRRNRSLAANDLADSRGRQPERDCQRVGGEASRLQLVLQHLAGVRCGSRQRPCSGDCHGAMLL